MEELLEELQILNGAQPEMLDRILTLCNINSGSGNLEGIEHVAKLLIEWYGDLNANFETIELPPRVLIDSRGEKKLQPLGNALQFIKRPDVRPRVLLCIHMDTVYDTDHPFQECRELPDGRINGPGVADAKGGLIIMLYALLALENSAIGKNIGWEVIINPDEELGSPSSADFLMNRASKADWGMLFEPSLPDGTLVSWRKGTGNFVFVVRGVSAHSGREFSKGRNAIVAAAKLAQQIDELNTNVDVTYNVGRIEGGGALNMVPDLAIVRVNVRIQSRQFESQVEGNFDRIMDTIAEQAGIEVERHGRFTSPPKEITPETEQLQGIIENCGSALNLDIKWQGTGGASDGSKFAAAGLANVDTFGPRGGNIHSGDEYLIVESLEERAKLAALVLLQLAADAAETDND